MNKVLKPEQRGIVRIAMALLTKKAEKVKKLEEELALSTASTDALISRVGLVLDALKTALTKPIHLTFALRRTLAQGLLLYMVEVEGTVEDELELAIDTDSSHAKLAQVRQLAELVSEQHAIGGEVTGEGTVDDGGPAADGDDLWDSVEDEPALDEATAP